MARGARPARPHCLENGAVGVIQGTREKQLLQAFQTEGTSSQALSYVVTLSPYTEMKTEMKTVPISLISELRWKSEDCGGRRNAGSAVQGTMETSYCRHSKLKELRVRPFLFILLPYVNVEAIVSSMKCIGLNPKA